MPDGNKKRGPSPERRAQPEVPAEQQEKVTDLEVSFALDLFGYERRLRILEGLLDNVPAHKTLSVDISQLGVQASVTKKEIERAADKMKDLEALQVRLDVIIERQEELSKRYAAEARKIAIREKPAADYRELAVRTNAELAPEILVKKKVGRGRRAPEEPDVERHEIRRWKPTAEDREAAERSVHFNKEIRFVPRPSLIERATKGIRYLLTRGDQETAGGMEQEPRGFGKTAAVESGLLLTGKDMAGTLPGVDLAQHLSRKHFSSAERIALRKSLVELPGASHGVVSDFDEMGAVMRQRIRSSRGLSPENRRALLRELASLRGRYEERVFDTVPFNGEVAGILAAGAESLKGHSREAEILGVYFLHVPDHDLPTLAMSYEGAVAGGRKEHAEQVIGNYATQGFLAETRDDRTLRPQEMLGTLAHGAEIPNAGKADSLPQVRVALGEIMDGYGAIIARRFHLSSVGGKGDTQAEPIEHIAHLEEDAVEGDAEDSEMLLHFADAVVRDGDRMIDPLIRVMRNTPEEFGFTPKSDDAIFLERFLEKAARKMLTQSGLRNMRLLEGAHDKLAILPVEKNGVWRAAVLDAGTREPLTDEEYYPYIKTEPRA